MPRGKLITLEGGEGVGKSTQVGLLVQHLQEQGIDAVMTREPGGDARGEAIRSLILSDDLKGIDPLAELFLFCAVRAQTMATNIRPLLQSGKWVVTDRSSLSSVVYQGSVKGADANLVQAVCNLAVGDCVPDLVCVLDLPAEAALARRHQAGGSNRFEDEGLQFHTQVNEAYREQGRIRGHAVVSANASIKVVSDRIWNHVRPLLG